MDWEKFRSLLKKELSRRGSWDRITSQAGIARGTLARLFRYPEKTKLGTLVRVAEAMGISLSELFKQVEQVEKETTEFPLPRNEDKDARK